MNSGNNDIPSFEYKPEFRQEMEKILVKRKSKKRFLFFLTWTLGGLVLAAGSFYFMQEEQQIPEEKIQKEQNVQEIFTSESVADESAKKQILTTVNSNGSTTPAEQKIKKTLAQKKTVSTSPSINTFQQQTKQEATTPQEIPINAIVSTEVVQNDSSLLEQDSLLSTTENKISFEDSLMSFAHNNSDTNLTDTLAKVPEDSVKNSSDHQWLLYVGAGANNSIGEGEYSNGIAPSFKLGVHYLKEFTKEHAVGIGLQSKLYRGLYNWGGYDTVKTSITNPNNSGYDKMEARVVTHNQNKYAMALSLPLYYRYSTPKFSFSVGASIDYLAANLYEQTADSSKYGINTFVFYTEVLTEKTSAAKVKKQDFRGINQLNFGPFIEVDYHLSPKISMGLTGQMLVQDITNNAVVNVNKNSPIYSLNVSLKYHFCK